MARGPAAAAAVVVVIRYKYLPTGNEVSDEKNIPAILIYDDGVGELLSSNFRVFPIAESYSLIYVSAL